jgi:GAF domain-containing protein
VWWECLEGEGSLSLGRGLPAVFPVIADTETEKMWEFAFRVVGAGLLAVLGGLGLLPFPIAWRLSLFLSAYALVAYLAQERGLMNPARYGILAVADVVCLSLVLGYAGLLDTASFLVLVPVVYAVAKRGTSPVAVGSVSAGVLFGVDIWREGGVSFTWGFLVQVAGVLGISLLAHQERIVVTPKTIQEMLAELARSAGAEREDQSLQALLDLREKYRQLSSAYRELEKRSRVDRLGVALMLSRSSPGDWSFFAETLRKELGADGVVLHTVSGDKERLVVRSSSGTDEGAVGSVAIALHPFEAAHKLRSRAQEAMEAMGLGTDGNTGANPRPHGNVLLRDRGRLVGLLTLFARTREQLEEVIRRAEEAEAVLARVVSEEIRRQQERSRMLEAELMYELVSHFEGSASPADLGSRASRVVKEILGCDSVNVWLIEEGKPVLVGSSGKAVRLFETFLYPEGGWEGWKARGFPEVLAPSTSDHPLIDPQTALRQRVGSYLVVPLRSGEETLGFITASAVSQGILGKDSVRVLRDASAEVARCLEVLSERGRRQGSRGLLTVREFQNEVQNLNTQPACLVYVEPLHGTAEEEPGSVMMARVVRELGLLLKRFAPREARICRRASGSYIVLLPGYDGEATHRWANELAAVAAMRSVEGGDGTVKVPLAIRVRVADLYSKIETFSESPENVA